MYAWSISLIIELKTCADKDILKTCLTFLSEDPYLRRLLQKLLGDEDDETLTFRTGSVILLQRFIMFLKSRQQIIREQLLQLKDNQQSLSSRQNVGKSRKPKEEPIECVVAFRKNPTNASTVLKFLTDVFMKSEPSVILIPNCIEMNLYFNFTPIGHARVYGKGEESTNRTIDQSSC